jgi:type IV secretion system protein VirB6
MWLIIAALMLALVPRSAAAQAINPLTVISQFESSGGTNTSCSATGACGIFQDVGSTWRQALGMIGIDPSLYPTANDAPASVQLAANAALINADGLQPWTCPGCDAPFAAYVASHGGPGAFQTSGLDTNPTDYSTFDSSPAALSAFLNGSDNGSVAGDPTGGGVGGGDTLTVANTNSPPAVAAAQSALLFENIYDSIINGIIGQIDTSIQTVEQIASGPATALLALAIAIMGIMTMLGNMDMAYFLGFAIRAAIVMAFVQVGNTFYSNWVENFVLSIPPYFAQAFSTTGTGGSPAQLFDQILNGWWASVLATWHSAGWSLHSIFIAIVLALATIVIVLPTLVAMFAVFLISTFLLLVMLTIGPLMILALLFQVTRRFFHGYVNVLVTGAIFALVVDIVLAIFANILTSFMGLFAPSGSPDTDIGGLMGIAGALLVCAFSMARLPRLIEGIGGGVAISMDTVGRFMSGGAIADAGAAVARRMI